MFKTQTEAIHHQQTKAGNIHIKEAGGFLLEKELERLRDYHNYCQRIKHPKKSNFFFDGFLQCQHEAELIPRGSAVSC